MNARRLITHIVRMGAAGIVAYMCFHGGNQSVVRAEEIFTGAYGSYTIFPDGEKAMTKNIDVGDYDRDGLKYYEAILPTNGTRKLFYLPHHPIHRLISVQEGVGANAQVLPLRDPQTYESNYCYHPRNGWITFRQAHTVRITVTYEYSTDLDIAAANRTFPATQPQIIYRNEGDFVFTEDPINSSVVVGECVAFGDYNRDSKLDLACGVWNGDSYLFVNSGNPPPDVYLQRVRLNHQQYLKHFDFVWGDYDSDGHPDLAAAQFKRLPFPNANTPQPAYYRYPLCTYQYHFDDENGLPVIMSGWNLYNDQATTSIEFGDFDLDGDLDIVSAPDYDPTPPVVIPIFSRKLRVWLNNVTYGPFLYTTTLASEGVKKIDAASLVQVASIGRRESSGRYGLNSPRAVCVDDAHIYIADTFNYRILKLNKNDFSYECEAPFFDIFAVAEEGNFVYIAAGYDIYKLNKSDLSTAAGTFGQCPVPIYEPWGIDATDTNVYVCDSFSKLSVLNATDLSHVVSIANIGPNVTLDRPLDIAVDTTTIPGEIYITDTGNDNVIKCDLNFNYINSTGTEGSGQNQFDDPKGITFDDNFLYIIDSNNNRIQVRRRDDLSFVREAPLKDTPSGIDYDAHGNSSPERTFSQHWESPFDKNYTKVECADFNGDGHLDLAAVSGTGYEIYQNNGDATFTPAWSSNTYEQERSVSTADVDNDGDIDIAFTNASRSGDHKASYYENKNNGLGGFNFERTWWSALASGNYNNFFGCDVQLADLNGDGAVDLTASAQNSDAAGQYLGIVVFNANPSGLKVTEITSTAKNGKEKIVIIMRYKTNKDGTLGELISTEIKP